MAWTSLRERLAGLPLVLAGPILRRTEPTSVTVWVALRESRTVTLEIFTAAGQLLFSDQQATTAIGLNLHLVALTARAPAGNPLVSGQNYLYDLGFGGGQSLASPGVLTATGSSTAVSYAPFERPSFALPPADLSNLRILHGSCRKPHGESLDAMAALDGIVQASFADANKRPHQLFLTGDQIYADDVADALLFMLRDADSALIGWQEVLPGNPAEQELRPGNRTPLTRRIGFTAALEDDDSVAKSHLLSFGEYCAMYLFAWSDTLWPAALPLYEDVFDGQPKRQKRKRFDDEIARLKDFSRDLGHVRRALANIPTYMICDDHEVTDDWFINLNWCRNVIKGPLGRRVLQNGMATIALFQGWGNTPAQFAAGAGQPPNPGAALLAALARLNTSQGSDEAARGQIAHLVGLPHADAEAATFVAELNSKQYLARIGAHPWQRDTLRFHYAITWDKHEVIVLDTRTWRAFPAATRDDYPALLSGEGHREQILSAPPPGLQCELTLVVSAGPVIGAPFIEWLQESGKATTRLERDSEAWALQRPAYERLFARLVQRSLAGGADRRFVLLCGDVHYGYTTRLQYWAKHVFETEAPADARAIFAQLTASSFKNETEGPAFLFWHFKGTKFLHRAGYTPIIDSLPIVGPLFFDHLPETREVLGWANPDRKKKLVGTLKLLLVPHDWHTEAGNPALTFPNDPGLFTTIGELTAEPDWRYRVDFLVAELETGDEFQPAAPSAPSADRQQALQSYRTVAKNFEDYAERWGNGKELVGLNNFGEVTFQWGDVVKKTVTHLIWWRLEQKSSAAAPLDPFPLTKYVVSLNFDDPKYPRPPLD